MKATRPDLPGRCHEAILTFRDPHRKTTFPRQCVLVNLGTELVKASTLEPMVKVPKDETTVVIAHAYYKKAPEEWQSICSTARAAKQAALRKAADAVKATPENLESWGFSFSTDPEPQMRLFIRVQASTTKISSI